MSIQPNIPKALALENRGREIVSTNFWNLAPTAICFSVNAGAVRVLLPTAKDRADIATGKIAVLSIGTDKKTVRRMAHLMLDDGSESPYCLFTDLRAFDVIPDKTWDTAEGCECIVYGPGLEVLARLPLRVRHGKYPNFDPVEA